MAVALTASLSLLVAITPARAASATLFNDITGPITASGPNSQSAGPDGVETNIVAKKFTATASGTANLLSIWTQCVGIGCHASGTIALRADVAGKPGSTNLGSATVTATDSLGSTPSCGVVASAPTLVAGTAYWAVLSSTSFIAWSDETNDPDTVVVSTDNGTSWNTATNPKLLSLRVDQGTSCAPHAVPNPATGSDVGELTSLAGGEPFTTVTVGNDGLAPLNLTSGGFSGGSSALFSLLDGEPGPLAHDFSFPTSVGGGGTAILYVACSAPNTPGSYRTTLNITTDDPTQPTLSWPVLCTVVQPVAITSAAATTFHTAVAGSFTVTSTGSPTSSLGETGTLPSGVTFVDNGDGTAALSGTPAAGTGGSYPVTITAANAIGVYSSTATQHFVLTVHEPPAFTNAPRATFVEGVHGMFTFTTSGFPLPAITEIGALPPGVTYVDNGDGTATLSGTPGAGSGGDYSLDMSAGNAVAPAASQTFTLTVDAVPVITSADHATFTAGATSTFSVTATGQPTPALSLSGSLPAGVTFDASTGTLSGTPASGTGGDYPLTITAANGVTPDATQTFTLTVNEAPSITTATELTFGLGANVVSQIGTTGYPAPTFSVIGLPSGLTLDAVTGLISGTPTTAGSFTPTITVTNSSGHADVQFRIEITAAPDITSSDHTTFTAGAAGTFTVDASGFPTPAVILTGPLPAGVTFVANSDGTATLAGTPATGAGGTYPVTITAANGVVPAASQSFTLTVDEAPMITSATDLTFSIGVPVSSSVHVRGYPAPTFSVVGSLPAGLTLDAATGLLVGTPTAPGRFTFSITVTNAISSATSPFTVLVTDQPVITSANHATFTVGEAGSFDITAAGSPTPMIALTGRLPDGVTFDSGTGTLRGHPGPGSGGQYALTVTASNGAGPAATQTLTLTVDEAASFTSPASTTFVVGRHGSFTVTALGYPTPSFALTGVRPAGVTFIDNHDGTATLAGTPAAGTSGNYPLTISVGNAVVDPDQTFTLTVAQTPAINSTDALHATEGVVTRLALAASGYPKPTWTLTGTLPAGLRFSAASQTITGRPAAGTAGSYSVTVTASNTAGTVRQDIHIVVTAAAGSTSSSMTSHAGPSTTVTSSEASSTGSTGTTLPFTGLPLGWLLIVAGLLLATGLVLHHRAARRHHS